MRSECIEILDGLVTCRELERLFQRNEQSLVMWRKNYGLPCISIPSERQPSRRFRLEYVLAWAQETGRMVDPGALEEIRARLAAAGEAARKRKLPAYLERLELHPSEILVQPAGSPPPPLPVRRRRLPSPVM